MIPSSGTEIYQQPRDEPRDALLQKQDLHSIRHYLYPDIDGLSLDALDNTNVESIN